MNSGKECVRFEHVSKIIKKRKIIEDVSLEIYQGEIFGLVGENGAGKTTLIRMMTGLIRPSEGKVQVWDEEVFDHASVLDKIGAIIEGPDLYKNLSGFENLRIIANMYPNVSKERIYEVAQLLGIKDRLGDKVKTYSLGMRQRLGIAVALLNHPKLLVLDEPLNGLDPTGVKEVRLLMKKLAETENVTIVISSHILSELELVCDRFAIIDHGKVLEVNEVAQSKEVADQTAISFLDDCNMEQVKKILQPFAAELISSETKKIILKAEPEIRAEVIKALAQNDLRIESVIPIQQSLEDYFVQKVGDKGEKDV